MPVTTMFRTCKSSTAIWSFGAFFITVSARSVSA